MKAKNCLIFGGSGQIGRNLIRKLTKNNYKVTVVTRNIHQKSYVIKTQANAGYIDIIEANIFEEYKIRKNSKILEKYSEAILFLDSKDQSKGINYLTELLKSPNEKIKILSATKLLDIYLQQKKFADSLNVIDTVLEDKKISNDSKKLFKIKKVLLNLVHYNSFYQIELCEHLNYLKIFELSIKGRVLHLIP